MKEGAEKRGKPKPLRLEDLANFKAQPHEPRPHSLSSAASDEPPTGEAPKTHSRIVALAQETIKVITEKSYTRAEALQLVRSEIEPADLPEFERVFAEAEKEALLSGALPIPDGNPPEQVATMPEQEERLSARDAPSTAAPTREGTKENEDREAIAARYKRIGGAVERFWKAVDAGISPTSAYVDELRTVYSNEVEDLRSRISLKGLERHAELEFNDAEIASEVARRRTEKGSAEKVRTADDLSATQDILRQRLAALALGEKSVADIERDIAAIQTTQDARALDEELAILERMRERDASRTARPQKKRQPPEKPPATSSTLEQLIPGVVMEDGKAVGVRTDKTVRLLTKREEAIVNEWRGASATPAQESVAEEQVAMSESESVSDAPYTKEHLERAQKNLRQRLAALGLDAKRTAAFEGGITVADSPQMVAALSRKLRELERSSFAGVMEPDVSRGTGSVPEVHARELSPEDLGLDPRYFEQMRNHPSLPNYYMHPNSRKLFSPEEVAEIRRQSLRSALRSSGSPHGPQENIAQQQQPIAPQPLAAGVIPDFVWRNFTREPLLPPGPQSFEQGLTLDVVLGDKKRAELFGEFVDRFGTRDLIGRYMRASEDSASMKAADYGELGILLQHFEQRSQLLEEVQQNLSLEDVKYMLLHTPSLAPLRLALKPERAHELMKTSLAYMFMRSSNAEINMMVMSQRANRDIRGSEYYFDLNARAAKRVGGLGIKADDLNWNNLDPKLHAQILKPGFIARRLGRGRRPAIVLEHIQTNRSAMGLLLGATLSKDEALLSRIAREAHSGGSERAPQVGERGIANIAEAAREKSRMSEQLNETSLLERIRGENFKREFRDLEGRSWDDSTPEAREEAFFAPYEEEKAERRGILGWFSKWLSSLFEVRVDRARQELRRANAFA